METPDNTKQEEKEDKKKSQQGPSGDTEKTDQNYTMKTTTVAAAKAATTTHTTTNPTVSKTQLKKIQKMERKRKMMQEKKQKGKEAKRLAAIAAGRDLEAERQYVIERRAAGDRQKRIAELWARHIQEAQTRFQICIDCSFENLMQQSEIASLVQQIRYCYAYNKKSNNPCLVGVTSLQPNSIAHKLLSKESGFDTWSQRAFTCTGQSLEVYYHQKNLSNVVYLTSDSTTTLQGLQDDKVYVIGGIVDRNRLKRTAIERAEKLGVATAKLPLDEYISNISSTKVLTCNHVFDILLQYRANDNDWSKALQQVLPSRKEAKIKITDSDPSKKADGGDKEESK
jgi:tRNA (guanine9-N1)-methyltransferase